MIPKIIHYCWFGNKVKPKEVIDNIDGWKKVNPDFKIIEWNENNFDVNINQYVKEAYKENKWAFVSDYARLNALYEFGGVYLDTDVETIKPFESLLDAEAFIGAESQYSMCTATIGAQKESKFIKKIIDEYENLHFIIDGKIDKTPNSQRIYKIITNEYGYEFSYDKIIKCPEVSFYPQDYFSPINCYTYKEECTDNTVSIHRYAGTWKDNKEKRKDKMMAFATRVIGEKNRNKIKNFIKKQG